MSLALSASRSERKVSVEEKAEIPIKQSSEIESGVSPAGILDGAPDIDPLAL